MEGSLTERARIGRTSGAVLKVRLSHVRSRNQAIPVLVFEGDTDVGPYEVWISRVREGLEYEPLPGKGKGQVLDLRKRLAADKSDLRKAVYFLVDRDFDDLRGQPSGEDIYCTEGYSVENHLVTPDVVRSVLTDELGCTAENDDRDRALAAFQFASEQMGAGLREANRRLFRAKKLGIATRSVSDKISDYLTIELHSVIGKDSPDVLATLIPVEREPTEVECRAVDEIFDSLDPTLRYRGKLVLAFFQRWISLLATARREGNLAIFSEAKNVGDPTERLTLRSLATRARVPRSFANFVLLIEGVATSELREAT
jgi:hypothetical protein